MFHECWFSAYPSNISHSFPFRTPILVSLAYPHYLDFSFVTILTKVTTNFSNLFYFLQIICLYLAWSSLFMYLLSLSSWISVLCRHVLGHVHHHVQSICNSAWHTTGTRDTFRMYKVSWIIILHLQIQLLLLVVFWNGLDHRLGNWGGNPHKSRHYGL